MRKYQHDTFYYGGEIIDAINSIIGKYSMDRGGKYVWAKDSYIVYCDLYENDNMGTIELHKDGRYVIGISALAKNGNDLVFSKDRITTLISSI